MRSPFPGMDPYLELQWGGDFHSRLITYLCDAIQPGLPMDLRARSEDRVFLETLGGQARLYRPDVHVFETVPPRGTPRASTERGASGVVAVAAPPETAPAVMIPFTVEVTEHFIQILDVRSGGKVITMIEVLSPSNKFPGSGRKKYLKKQRETVTSGEVNLVEIDLLRAGRATTLTREADLPPGVRTPYHASVLRASDPDRLAYYRIPLRERLPRLPIPLRPTDPDVILDLQAVVDQAYERGRYDDIDYSLPLVPPLLQDDSAWADATVRARQQPAARPA